MRLFGRRHARNWEPGPATSFELNEVAKQLEATAEWLFTMKPRVVDDPLDDLLGPERLARYHAGVEPKTEYVFESNAPIFGHRLRMSAQVLRELAKRD